MRRQLPPWAMGLAAAPLGFYYGFVSTALPILLAARGVSVEKIAEVSAVGFSPTFWAFLLCPVLDVYFSKRTYAMVFAAVAAICLGLSTLLTGNLPALIVVVTLGCASTVLFGNAHGGWMPHVIEDKHYAQVGGTSNIANLGAAGAFAWLTVHLMRTLPATTAAVLLALLMMIPTALLFFIPLPKHSVRSASETFSTFFGDLYRVCKRRECLLGLLCFLSPTACFALTNVFPALGADFHASENWVTAINGPYVAVVCSLGCLLGIWICSRFARRTVYIVTGFGGAIAALGLIRAPHTLLFFALGVLVYNFFTGINYTAFTALCYEIVGPGNALASTQMALLAASANLPISYMTAIDGRAHDHHGLGAMLAVDALSSIAVGATLLLIFSKVKSGTRAAEELVAR